MKTKGFSLQRVLARRDQLFSVSLRPYIGSSLVGQTIQDVCDDLAAVLPQTVSRAALSESLRVMAGTDMTQRTARELAWRLAGNVDKLIAGEPAFPWAGQFSDEVVPVRVERMRFEKRQKTKGYVLYCRALAGSPCPMVFPQFFSLRSFRAVCRTLGFSAPWGQYPMATPLYFVNLVFFAHLEASRSAETPYFKTISASAGLVTHNKPKIAVRCRVKPCPLGYKHECSKCWMGYNECPAAIHPRTLVQRPCTQCAAVGFFEPEDEGAICLNCQAAHGPT